jgi:hypothetical protein
VFLEKWPQSNQVFFCNISNFDNGCIWVTWAACTKTSFFFITIPNTTHCFLEALRKQCLRKLVYCFGYCYENGTSSCTCCWYYSSFSVLSRWLNGKVRLTRIVGHILVGQRWVKLVQDQLQQRILLSVCWICSVIAIVSFNFISSVTPVCVGLQCNAAHSRALSQYRRAVYPCYRNHWTFTLTS